MCEIKVTISAPDLSEAIKALADTIYKCFQPTVSYTPCGNQVSIHSFDPTESRVETFAGQPVTQLAETSKSTFDRSPETPVQPVSNPAARIYTIAELSKAGADLCTQGKMPQLIELLKNFGVQALTQVPKDRYGELAAGLISLGAQL